jgi:hypothetical protein
VGDRALVIFHDKAKKDYSPVVYLHWHGSDVGNLLKQLKALMAGRLDDVAYTVARFVGLAHEAIPGNLSVGIFEKHKDFLDQPEYLADFSHGDAGVFMVDASDFSCRCYGGYGLTEEAAA